MAIVKQRLCRKMEDASYSIIHLETSSDLVVRSDGQSVETGLSAVETALQKLNSTGEGSVTEKVTQVVSTEVAKIVADAPAAYDTLKEIADWISSHESSAATMNSSISTLKSDMSTAKSNISTNASNISTLKSDVSALKNKSGLVKKSITFTASNFSSGSYTISASTHGLGADFVYSLYYKSGTSYISGGNWTTVEAQVTVSSAGAITINASTGFAGKIVLVG